jgi:nicotinate-nucleotide adenylyltransferase
MDRLGSSLGQRGLTVRLGLLGGTFNPIHIGHLRGAEEAREAFNLEKIYFIPAALPPHKDDRIEVSPTQRLEIVQLAVENNTAFSVCDVELSREGKSYTVETLHQFRRQYREAELFFILGMDSFLEVTTWKRYEDLFSLCNFVVLRRPGSERKNPEDLTPQRYWAAFHPDKDGNRWIHTPSGLSVYFLNNPLIDISSSEIRERIQTGRSVRYMMQEKVAAYIHEHGLYGRT